MLTPEQCPEPALLNLQGRSSCSSCSPRAEQDYAVLAEDVQPVHTSGCIAGVCKHSEAAESSVHQHFLRHCVCSGFGRGTASRRKQQGQQQVCKCWHSLWCMASWSHQLPRLVALVDLVPPPALATSGVTEALHLAPVGQDHPELASCLLRCSLVLMGGSSAESCPFWNPSHDFKCFTGES